MRETQRKGDIAVAQAIATFTRMGWDVSVPLTESALYDLVVDTGDGLVRVQCKFSCNLDVDLRRIHSNSKGYVIKPNTPNGFDWLYVLRPDGAQYLVKRAITTSSVRPKYDELLVP